VPAQTRHWHSKVFVAHEVGDCDALSNQIKDWLNNKPDLDSVVTVTALAKDNDFARVLVVAQEREKT